MRAQIDVVDTGLVYRNPRPHLQSIHAWHPSLVRLDDGTLLAGFDLGEAVESLDYRTYLSRSSDGGRTWSPPVPLFENVGETGCPFEDQPGRRSTHTARLGRTRDGLLTAFGGRFFRDDPNEGLVNRDNLGYVPMELILSTSADGGRTWSRPRAIAPPLVGPAFEVCHRIVERPDGIWLAPTSTWKGWHGDAPHGMRAIVLVSRDRGRTWPEWRTVAHQHDRRVISWEQGIAELPDGRLLAVVWSFNEETGRSELTRYTVAGSDLAFSPLLPTDLRGETAKPLALADGRVLVVYRRADRPGLWGHIARIEGDEWIGLGDAPLWRGGASIMEGAGAASDELSGLKFGFPSLIQLPDSDVLVVFWCREECVHNIRWIRLRVR